MQKHVKLVDLVKSFPTNIYLQNLASIQKRTSPVKFAHLAEKSEEGSISNLSTKAPPAPTSYPPGAEKPAKPAPKKRKVPPKGLKKRKAPEKEGNAAEAETVRTRLNNE